MKIIIVLHIHNELSLTRAFQKFPGVQMGAGRRRVAPSTEVYGDVQPPGVRFDILEDYSRYFKRFKLRGRKTTMRIHQPRSGDPVLKWLGGAFRDVLTHITAACEGSDYVGIIFAASGLAHGPVWLSFRPARDYSFEDIWRLVSSVAQSLSELNIDDTCHITTSVVCGVEGTGKKGLSYEGIAKPAILTITNTDNVCLPRSLVAARAYTERGQIRSGELHKRWQRIRQAYGSLQREEAQALTRSAGVNIPRRRCGMPEIVRYQNFLSQDGIAIVIYEFLTLGRGEEALFDGTQCVLDTVRSVHHTLYILYYKRSHHFEPILN